MLTLSSRHASGALLLGGAMWGVYWIPVRWLGDMGLNGPWAGIALFVATLLALSPFVWTRRQDLARNWRPLIWSGAFTGAAFGLYTISLFYTDVVRAILLFYLTPVWSTVLGLVFLGERMSLPRACAILLGIGGLIVVLGGGATIPLPQNFGDWLALASGMAWALGTLGLYTSRGISVTGQIFSFLLGGLAVALGAALLMPDLAPTGLAAAETLRIGVFVVLAGLYVLPMTWLTVWPATLLSPARVGLLLMSEVVVGLLSAAMFAQEHFGAREAIGAILIVGAAAVELCAAPQTPAKV